MIIWATWCSLRHFGWKHILYIPLLFPNKCTKIKTRRTSLSELSVLRNVFYKCLGTIKEEGPEHNEGLSRLMYYWAIKHRADDKNLKSSVLTDAQVEKIESEITVRCKNSVKRLWWNKKKQIQIWYKEKQIQFRYKV